VNESTEFEERAARFRETVSRIEQEVAKVIVGQRELVRDVVTGLFTGGHVLLEGVPGIGKTLLVHTLADCIDCSFSRIQFTPDLMPSDIIGTRIVEEDEAGRKQFSFQRGPVFTQVLLADEVNRATPKTQSALLEAMQEKQVTVSGESMKLDQPFFVIATQNPLEMEGTYPLPEAQLDRFLFNVKIDYLPAADELDVVMRTTSSKPAPIEAIFSGEDVERFQQAVREVPVAREIGEYAVRLASLTRPGRDETPDFVNEWVGWGAGTRASQTLVLGAKARALLMGRAHVQTEDIVALAHPTLRHRVLPTYKAEAEGVTIEHIVDRLLEEVPKP